MLQLFWFVNIPDVSTALTLFSMFAVFFNRNQLQFTCRAIPQFLINLFIFAIHRADELFILYVFHNFLLFIRCLFIFLIHRFNYKPYNYNKDINSFTPFQWHVQFLQFFWQYPRAKE